MHSIFLLVTLFVLPGFPRDLIQAGAAVPDLTVSYSIGVTSKKGGDMGLAETYNGGVETLFAGNKDARLRLVSLMRVQSIFLSTGDDQVRKFTIVKESGKDKYVTHLTEKEWKQYNKKYDGVACKLTEDTAHILRHLCKKAIITLKDGKVITAWYTEAIQSPVFSSLEPAFSGVPGLVLKYEYTSRKKTISYTATAISRNPIAPDVFTIPAAGAATRSADPLKDSQ
ncbi:GLPGLI family protein [Flavitalea sp. BT771]|uniref:GLPGLI family protein n=1 Tax=Flavitalea sp. BT771 TaxID=3063329 RepID=UPI0026E17542|nr:GLPGLI family protein [Flavitalea sp. BT771]MDO6429178.1 GLPGLI family protein [Flavitalea sp. BT771]MDV6218694.1 GLPGLI family protein [Flavitalea sp. BT771]